jgi:hypothetical protein
LLHLVNFFSDDFGQARKYIFDSLGADFLENNVLDLEAMLDEAENRIPLICLLSTGSDPTSQIEALARLRVQVLHPPAR